jgi:hypothetical protein
MEKLTRSDIIFLKTEIKQILAANSLLLIILPIIYFAISAFIQLSNIFEDKEYAHIVLVTILSIITFLFIFQGLEKPIKDITSNQKRIFRGIILTKSINSKYTYHTNIIVDLTSNLKPRLIEYFFTLNETAYFVSKEQYDNFNEGDEIKISFSLHTNKIINIEKG